MTYYDLGAYTRPITTKSPEAQVWFDRGLNWSSASTTRKPSPASARRWNIDPGCAMAHWGIAYAAGPNYNLPWHLYDPAGKAQALAAAYDAMQAALACLDQATPVEQALIRALPARYPQREPIEDQSAWDTAFTDGMRTLFKAIPQRSRRPLRLRRSDHERDALADVGSFAPAASPKAPAPPRRSRCWKKRFNGIPAAWDHPGLLHLYVHLMEMSPFRSVRCAAGDRLRDLVPDAGHLIHMPTHIDVLCGHYRDVVVYNQKAIVADRKFLAREGPMNVYALYRTHNHHFAIYGAMFLGQYTPAHPGGGGTDRHHAGGAAAHSIAADGRLHRGLHPDEAARAGALRQVARDPRRGAAEDRALYCSTTAMMLYAKSGRPLDRWANIAEAEKARDGVSAGQGPGARRRGASTTTPSSTCSPSPSEMLNGELEYRRGNFDAAFAHLRTLGRARRRAAL